MIYHKKNGVSVEWYEEREARKLGFVFIPWREARESGQWVISDDRVVLQVVYVRPIVELQKGGKTPRTRYRIKTGLATRYPHGKAPMEVKKHMVSRNYGLYPETWYEEYDRKYPALRSMLTKAVITGVIRMSKNRRYTRDEYAEMIRIAKKLFDTKHRSWYHVRTYFGREEVRDAIRKDIVAIAKKRNINVDKVFDLINEAESLAREKKDAKVILAVAKEYAGIIGFSSVMKESGEGTNALELPGAEDTYDRIIEKGARKNASGEVQE